MTNYCKHIEQNRDIEFQNLKESNIVHLDHAASTLYPKTLIEKRSQDLTQNLYTNTRMYLFLYHSRIVIIKYLPDINDE